MYQARASGMVMSVRDDRVVSFRSSTPDLDRHGTRIISTGIKTDHYDRNPIFLWGHDGYGSMLGGAPDIENVIGRTVAHDRHRDGFDHDVEFAPADVNPKAEMALRMVEHGILGATSLGFAPIEGQWHEEQSDTRGAPPIIVFDEVELLEVSLVPIPSNPYAHSRAMEFVEELARPGQNMNNFDRFLAGLGDDKLASRVEGWVRSARRNEQRSKPAPAHPAPDPQRESEGDEAEQRSVLADLFANLSITVWRPSVRSQVYRALDF